MSREVELLLGDMAEACRDAIAFLADTDTAAFAAGREKLAAVERKLFVIGEAAARLPEAVRDAHPSVEWRAIIGMRNILAHGYWKVDPRVLWDAVKTDLPALLRELEQALEQS